MSSFESNPNQADEDWIADKVGKLSASLASAAFALSKRDGKPLQAWQDLVDDLVAERITGRLTETFVNAAMKHGIEYEAMARNAYAARTGNIVELVGFIDHPDIPMFGCSPDGPVGDDGLVEIKCPFNAATHFKRICAGGVPPEYVPQLLFQLLVTGRKWVDFVDFFPMDESSPYKRAELYVCHFVPTEAQLEDALNKALNVLDAVNQKLLKLEKVL